MDVPFIGRELAGSQAPTFITNEDDSRKATRSYVESPKVGSGGEEFPKKHRPTNWQFGQLAHATRSSP